MNTPMRRSPVQGRELPPHLADDLPLRPLAGRRHPLTGDTAARERL